MQNVDYINNVISEVQVSGGTLIYSGFEKKS